MRQTELQQHIAMKVGTGSCTSTLATASTACESICISLDVSQQLSCYISYAAIISSARSTGNQNANFHVANANSMAFVESCIEQLITNVYV